MSQNDHLHAPSETLAPPMIVIDNHDSEQLGTNVPPDPDYARRKWSPLRDYAIRLTDLYVQINLAFLAKEVLPDHDMLESLVRVTLQSKYAEWITDPRPPSSREGRDADQRERPLRGYGRERAGQEAEGDDAGRAIGQPGARRRTKAARAGGVHAVAAIK